MADFDHVLVYHPQTSSSRALLTSLELDSRLIDADRFVDLIEGNPRFTSLPTLNHLMINHGYWLIGVCEQYGARYSQGAEFCNAVFCRQARLE